jgi:hypothetical protein
MPKKKLKGSGLARNRKSSKKNVKIIPSEDLPSEEQVPVPPPASEATPVPARKRKSPGQCVTGNGGELLKGPDAPFRVDFAETSKYDKSWAAEQPDEWLELISTRIYLIAHR